uniref:Retinol binding protein 1 n=1 Tax=Sinocyclocheilus grahami TaxID=75366 RepID=A0A672N0K1_SINGR
MIYCPSINFEKLYYVNVAVREIATLLKPDKDITQNGDHFIIKTFSTVRNYNMDFVVGPEFEEDLSGTTITWDGDNLVCVQKGEFEGRGWTHWIEGDELHLVGQFSCISFNALDGIPSQV